MAQSKPSPPGVSWLASLRWRADAPATLQRAARSDPAAFVGILVQRLEGRANGSLGAAKALPRLGGASAVGSSKAARDEGFLTLAGADGDNHVDRRVVRPTEPQPADARSEFVGETLDLLARCHVLPHVASQIPKERFLGLLQRIVRSANQAIKRQSTPGAVRATEELGNGRPTAPAELETVLQAELMATAAWLLPELADTRELRARSRSMLGATLRKVTDANGVPAAHVLPALSTLLASLLRSAELARDQNTTPWGAAAQTRFEKLLLQTRRLIRPDGCLPFAADEPPPTVATSRSAKRDDVLVTLAEQFLRRSPKRKGGSKGPTDESPAVVSEQSRVAILRSDLSRKSDWLGVAWDRKAPALELLAGGKAVLAGPWEVETALDGRRLQGTAPPVQTCWTSDDDLDYLELRTTLEGGAVLERHLLLAREGPFALIADSLLAPPGNRVDLVAKLPLAPGVRFEPDRTAREGWLRGKRRLARAIPLWLPQWRIEGTPGALEQVDGQLVLRASGPGRRFFMPLVLDWGDERGRSRVEWRRLSVAEDRRLVPSDRAAGFRLRIGNRQLLLYRSLGPRAARSLLGHQTRYQFVVGRFDENGDVEPLIEIE
jgi:hypothetical protein